LDNEELQKEFTDLALSAWAMDYYQVRLAILSKLRAELPRMAGTLLDVGCGRSPYKKVVLSPPAASQSTLEWIFPVSSIRKGRTWNGME